MKKKVKNKLKKHLTGVTLVIGIIFLIIGVVAGFLVYKMTTTEGETKIELNGETVINLQVGQQYQELGYTFIIDGVDYKDSVVVSNDLDITVSGSYIITYKLETDGHNITLSRVINVLGGVSDGE